MERDEQIKQAAIERGCIEGTAEYFGFIQGARYADQNPTSPWKDASVEKPPYDPDCEDETSVYVIVRQERRVGMTHYEWMLHQAAQSQQETMDLQ